MIAIIVICIFIIFILNKPYGDKNIDKQDFSLDPTLSESSLEEFDKVVPIKDTSRENSILNESVPTLVQEPFLFITG